MQVMKHLHDVPFDDIPKLLIEFSWETVWSWRFVMIHIKDCIPNLLFSSIPLVTCGLWGMLVDVRLRIIGRETKIKSCACPWRVWLSIYIYVQRRIGWQLCDDAELVKNRGMHT